MVLKVYNKLGELDELQYYKTTKIYPISHGLFITRNIYYT